MGASSIRNMAGSQGNSARDRAPEITAKRGVYEVGRDLRARRCEAGPAILRIAGVPGQYVSMGQYLG